MTVAEMIAQLPDDAKVDVTISGVRVGELREALESNAPVYITTTEAAKRFSRSSRWWCEAAKEIPGAYKDRMWRLPLRGCEEHIASLVRPKRRRRGPWKATSPQAVGDRASGMEAG